MSNLEQLQKIEEALDDLKTSWAADMDETEKKGKLRLNGPQFKNKVD